MNRYKQIGLVIIAAAIVLILLSVALLAYFNSEINSLQVRGAVAKASRNLEELTRVTAEMENLIEAMDSMMPLATIAGWWFVYIPVGVAFVVYGKIVDDREKDRLSRYRSPAAPL